MAFAPTKPWKSHSITRSDDFLNQNQPTDSAEEAEIFTHVSSVEEWHCLARIIPSADLRFHDEGILSNRLGIMLRLCEGVSSQSLWCAAPSTSHSFSGCTVAVKTFIKLPGRSFSSQPYLIANWRNGTHQSHTQARCYTSNNRCIFNRDDLFPGLVGARMPDRVQVVVDQTD